MTDKTNTNNTLSDATDQPALADMKMNQDLKHSILIVSLLVNMVVLTLWIALQVTTQYDGQVASFLFTR
jgi:hypothetical protein